MKMPHPRFAALFLCAVAVGCARHRGDVAVVGTGAPPLFETRVEVLTQSLTHADYYVADFDGDGVKDMAVISLTGELRILLGNGANFVVVDSMQLSGRPIWMSGGDFDNDGDNDLVIVREDANLTDLWENDGNGVFSQSQSLAVGQGALSVVVADFDGDSLLDVAVSRPSTPEIVIGFGDGAMGFRAVQQLSLPGGGSAFHLSVGDATRDGFLDLVVCDPPQSRVLIFPGPATVATQNGGAGQAAAPEFDQGAIELQVPGTAGAVTFGDLSGDGFADLVVAAWDAERYVVITDIFPFGKGGPFANGGPDGSFPNVWDYQSFDVPVPERPALATVADVTGDGLPDLVACLAFDAMVCIQPQSPGGGVDPEQQFVLDASDLPLRPFVADFDGNGRNDVMALSGVGSRINLWLSRDSGTLLGSRNHATGLDGAAWMEGADFDGDGRPDIVTGSVESSTIAILEAAPGDRLAPSATFPVGAPVYQLASGDLDGDGRVDVVVCVPGGIKVLRNQSTPGNFQFEVLPGLLAPIPSGDYPFGVSLGDLDRDGDVEIVVCDFIGGGLHIVPGTPTPFVFDTPRVIPVGLGPADVAIADFTGDGLVDLAVSRFAVSDIAVLRNEGSLNFVELLAIPVGQSPNYLVTADFDRNGRADLVVSNGESGTVTVLFGSPTGFSGQSFTAGVLPAPLLARDLTGDGFDDILVASLRSGDFRVLVNDGRGGFPLAPTFPGTLGASDALLQDMTGDGLPDLLISSVISDRVSLVRNIRE